MSSMKDAKKAVCATIERGVKREEIVKLLAKYETTKVCFMQAQYLDAFTRECNALMPAPPPMPTPKFAIGEKVHFRKPPRSGGAFRVIGYELRYVLACDSGEHVTSHYGHSADNLIAAPPVPQPAPKPSVELFCTCMNPPGRELGSHHSWHCANYRSNWT